MKLEACLPFTLRAEGGFVNDPHDPGGATYKGITLATYRRYKKNPKLTAANLRAASDDDINAIYRTGYWNVVRGDDLPPGVDMVVFDFAVNAGPQTSAEELQALVGAAADGAIGPATLAAVAKADPADLVTRLSASHKAHYATLPGAAYYLRGWTNRVEACHVAALALIHSNKEIT